MKLYIKEFLNYYFIKLFSILPSFIKFFKNNLTDIFIFSTPLKFYNLMYYVKNHIYCQFQILSEITAYNCFQSSNYDFTIVYTLLSIRFNQTLNIVIKINKYNLYVKSLCYLFGSSGWLEREVFDLFGISFINHKDLRRILLDYGFKGHPLRKDFPLSGFFETFYNDLLSRIVIVGLNLEQISKF